MALGLLSGGTISVSASGTVVTGTATAFAQVYAGCLFVAGGQIAAVASIQSNTELTLSEGWPGSTLAGASFTIVLISQGHALSVRNQERVQELLTSLSNKAEIHYVTSAPGAGLGDDDDTAIDTVAKNFYRKVAGAWTLVWTGTITSAEVTDLVVITQAAFDAQATKDLNTLYAIKEA